jgi:hypothetical protein
VFTAGNSTTRVPKVSKSSSSLAKACPRFTRLQFSFRNSTWDPALDAVIAAPKHHKVLFENERLRVLEVTLEPKDEEPLHHHRWPSVFVFDQVQPPVYDFAPDDTQLPPNRDVIKAIETWNGQGCLVVHMAPQPAGRVFNASEKTIHGIRVEMKTVDSC